MQVHTFETKDVTSTQLNTTTYLGVHLEVNDPFHLCIPLKELQLENIRVVIYSIGRKKEVIWGTYNFKTRKFLWQNACKADLNTISRFLKIWNAANFTTVADVVKNRISGAIREIIGNGEGLTVKEYTVCKYLLAYWRNPTDDSIYTNLEAAINEIDVTQLLKKLNIQPNQSKYPEFESDLPLEIDLTALKQYKNIITAEVLDYEAGVNLSNIDRDVLYEIIDKRDKLQNIVTDFHNNVQTSVYNTDSFVSMLQTCLSPEQCASAGYEPDSCSIYEFMNEYMTNFE